MAHLTSTCRKTKIEILKSLKGVMKQKWWAYFYLLCANKDTHNTCTVYRHWFDHKSINSSPNSILSCHACLMKYKYEWNAETDTWSSHSGQDNATEQSYTSIYQIWYFRYYNLKTFCSHNTLKIPEIDAWFE